MENTVTTVDLEALDLDLLVVEFRSLADWWANRIQWSEEDHEDLVQDGMLSFITTIRGYKKSGKEIRDLPGLASMCLSSAMKWYYKSGDRAGLPGARVRAGDKVQIQRVEISDVQISDLGLADIHQTLVVKEFMDAVDRELGPVARKIVENLFDPGPEVVALAVEEMEEKAQRRANGERVVGHSSLRTTQDHVRRFSNLTEGQWERHLKEVRLFTQKYFQLVVTAGRTAKASPRSLRSSASPTLGSTTHSPSAELIPKAG